MNRVRTPVDPGSAVARRAGSSTRPARGPKAHRAARPAGPELRAEARLFEGLLRRDGAACTALAEAYGPQMLATAGRYVRSEADAEDVVQSALILVIRSLPAFAGANGLAPWLHRLVVNCALLLPRKRRRRPEVRLESPHAGSGTEPQPILHAPLTDADALVRREERVGQRAALRQLPDTRRASLRLHAPKGQSHRGKVLLLAPPHPVAKRTVNGGRSALLAPRALPGRTPGSSKRAPAELGTAFAPAPPR